MAWQSRLPLSNSAIVQIGVIVVPAAKNAISKNHPKDILHDKNHLYGIVLVHITSNITFKTKKKHFQMENIFRWPDNDFFLKKS